MKKLTNKPENVVQEELEGMAAAHADLICIEAVEGGQFIVVRKDAPVQSKVGVIAAHLEGQKYQHCAESGGELHYFAGDDGLLCHPGAPG
jgi:dihydroxyacetone kinase-like protein